MRGLRGLVVVAGIGLSLAPAAAERQEPRPRPRPSFYRPVVADGMTFPVARTNWFSVIEFENDWHAPRMRIVDGRWRLVGLHEGLDVIAEEGTPVLSMTAGTVERVGWTFYSGTRVGVRGHDDRYYFYAHLSGVAPDIEVGGAVRPGSVLGLVGNTGYGPPGHRDEFPPHLHVGIQQGATWINPYPTVSRLYTLSARFTARGERRLARLSGQGRTHVVERVASRLYADLLE